MRLQIREMVLWPRSKDYPPRRLPFETGRVNVVSGWSRTGKSAVIPIIDYCLGSEKCRIPVGVVRQACEWFGIVVQAGNEQLILARREPGEQGATEEMYFEQGPTVGIPEAVTRNVTARDVKNMLDDLVGLPRLEMEPGGSSLQSRPSFRDMCAFLFQPQNVVANPEILFYRTERFEHREKLREIFPYVIGAITAETLAKRHELEDIRKELARKRRELENIRRVSKRWQARVQVLVSEAKELGLAGENVEIETATFDQLKLILQRVVQSAPTGARTTPETIDSAIRELAELQTRESKLSMQLTAFRRRMAEIMATRETSTYYEGALHVLRDRLSISRLIPMTEDLRSSCPFCGSELDRPSRELRELREAVSRAESEATRLSSFPASLDREYQQIREQLRSITEELQAVQVRRRALSDRSEQVRRRQYEELRVSRFIGNLEQSLATYAAIGEDSELEREIEELENQSRNLQTAVSQEAIRKRQTRALTKIQTYAAEIIPNLDAEYPNAPIEFSIRHLAVRIGGAERSDYLWELGSGSNWVSYHIAITLALHRHFLDLDATPVPGFIVFDQPSQVYFPRRLATRASESDDERELELLDQDRQAVRRTFGELSRVARSLDGALQIIVLDHASSDVWGDVEGIHCSEEWRDGRALVPLEWIEAQ